MQCAGACILLGSAGLRGEILTSSGIHIKLHIIKLVPSFLY